MQDTVKKDKIIDNFLKVAIVISSIFFVMPSIRYYMETETILNFKAYFQFLLNTEDRLVQTAIYLLVFLLLTITYVFLIKRRKTAFKSIKSVLILVAIVSIVFIMAIPFMCSDVFYYLGVGRIDSTYWQNPYYTTIQDFVETGDNVRYLQEDTVLAQGYANDWKDSTVVYGPVWQLICKGVAFLSFGNIDIGLLVFKIVNVLIHLINCYLIWKITNKKIFSLIYGLNPFILIEGISSVHNDMFVVMFILLAIYFLKNKRKILPSVVFLSLGAGIKYFPIILLPFMIIYHFREEKPLKRFLECIKYGIIFMLVLFVPYLIYIQDLNVMAGIFTQQEKLAKSIYILISEYFNKPENIVKITKTTLLGIFAIIYFFTCVVILNKKDIKFKNMMEKANCFLVPFIFLLITNFQPWYIMWLFPIIMFQKPDTIKMELGISLISEIANSVFLVYTEGWRNGTPFIFIMLLGAFLMLMYIKKERELRRKKAFLKSPNFKEE